MNHKVLLAEDSLTIVKVIKITLANQPYDLIDVSSEDELFSKLKGSSPKLILLDFNLSEKSTGYEITEKIKKICPNAHVLLLLGTFDNIDEAMMVKCGASDKIVKPFDSNKLIAVCKRLVDSFRDEEMTYPTTQIKEANTPAPRDEDQWTVTHTSGQKLNAPPSSEDKSTLEIQNPLLKEVSDWGMSIPGVINDFSAHDKLIDVPPVIDITPLLRTPHKPEAKYPQNDDLIYPSMEEMTSTFAEIEGINKASPQISISNVDDFGKLELQNSFFEEESNVKTIQDQIRDEVEDNLWQVDEFEDLKKEVAAKIEEVKGNFQPTRNDFDESLFRPIDDSESLRWSDAAGMNEEKTDSTTIKGQSSPVNHEQIRGEMEELVKKYVKEYLDQMFHKGVEKVAWEVIPDLAENLIRQELSKISKKIINDHA